MKANKNANIISLDSEDLKMTTEEIVEVVHTSFKTTEEGQEEIPGTVTISSNLCVKRLKMLKLLSIVQSQPLSHRIH